MIRIANIGRLVTMVDGGLNIIQDAEIHVEGKTITFAGSRNDALKCHFEQEIDVDGKLVTPGLIDAHTHTVFGGDRCSEFEKRCQGASYQQIASEGGGIRSTVAKTRQTSDEELVESTLSRLRKLVRNGTTSVEIKSGYGLDPATEARMLRIAGTAASTAGLTVKRTFLGLHAVPVSAQSSEQYIKEVLSDRYEEAWELCDYADIFVEDGYFTAHDAGRLSDEVIKRGKGLRMHVDQMRDSGGAALAARLKAITADHLEYSSPEGIQQMAAAGTTPILLPASVHGLGKSQYPNARAMLDAGLPVVLATDLNPGSSPCYSLPFCMNLAVLYMKMTVEECLRATTVNAAQSLGLNEQKGQLKEGFDADLVMWDAKHESELPYWTGSELASLVLASGRVIFSRTS